MNKTMKIVSVVMAIMIAFMPIALAVSVGGVEVEVNTNTNGVDSITSAGGKILGVIKVVGILISVGVIMVVGIKYMMGSAEEKAEYKKVMIPLIVGAVLLGCASLFADKLIGLGDTLLQ